MYSTYLCLQIVCTLVFGACLAQAQQARRLVQQYQPQQANNYQEGDDQQEAQQYQPAPKQQQQQYQPKPQSQDYPQEQRVRSTTFIPIIRFDKEQGADGSYKAA